jgi:hypothetical protein
MLKEPTSDRTVHNYGISHFFKDMVYPLYLGYLYCEVVALKL